MTYTATPERKVHGDLNLKHFRKNRGIKQDALAFEFGEDFNQKQVSDVLKIPLEAFQNFNGKKAVNIIANTFDYGSIGYPHNVNCFFHPIDRLIQLHDEKIALYERILKEKDEMMARLDRLLGKE